MCYHSAINLFQMFTKTAYETWKVPFVVDGYTIWFGKPSKEIFDDENKPYIFKIRTRCRTEKQRLHTQE